jgi:uncharacterized protein (DUF4415 family)
MHMYIQWDEQKRRRNLHEHDIDFLDLEAFFAGDLLTREDLLHGYCECRFQSIGMLAGTLLLVVWRPVDTKGKTNWERLRNMPEAEIRFTRDAPRTRPQDWANAIAHRGLPLPSRKKQIALRVDEDVLEWFKAQGAGYQTRMNAVLREYRNAHR